MATLAMRAVVDRFRYLQDSDDDEPGAANVRKNRNRIERPAQHHDTGEDAYHAEEGLSGASAR